MKLVESEADIAFLQQHLKEVLEGQAFRGSQRSAQFLRYIVEQALAGHLDSLKERLIGVELFGRSPSYDTGNDAIVRVTASDVRKRLVQHYGKYASASDVRIALPLGSYLPEFHYDPGGHEHLASAPIATPIAPAQPRSTIQTALEAGSEPASPPAPHIERAPEPPRAHPVQSRLSLAKIAIALIVLLNLFAWGYVWHRFQSHRAAITPLAGFFSSPHPVYLVTSDPDIAAIQQFTGTEVSVSDYVNHRIFSASDDMTPEMRRFRDSFMRADKAAAVDAQIAVHIGELAEAHANRILVRTARSIQMADLQSDNNFILLGSPRSNPWSALFSDQLDFQFVYDKNSGQEIIRNVHPRPNEAAQYVPTAMGGATGKTYAIIALVRNFDQYAQILLLAGADAEGTEAAGRILTDGARLAAALEHCGLPPQGPMQRFELLVKLNTMAGIPSNESIEACHILPSSPAAS
ncbi:MAG TPA: hypothetical protein VK596_06375 [Edaphobacter sp.]|nr:hypothetical protein [Edaphobacter sp.]